LDIDLKIISNINRRPLREVLITFFVGILFTVGAWAHPSMPKVSTVHAHDDSKPYMTKEFEVDCPGLLKIFTVSGNIDVIPSPTANKVKVELYLDRGFAFWSNSNNLDNFRIIMLQRRNEIVASVERKQRETSFFSDQIRFSFRVYVPEEMSTDLKTLGGKVSLQNVQGKQSIKTNGGSIEIANIRGRLEAYTSGGNIDIENSEGTIYAQTDGGNISIDRSSGEIRLKTSGGKIVAEHISGSMLGRVGGGDIWADFDHVERGIDLQTSAGNIHLEIPDFIGYQLLLRGTEVDFAEKSSVQGDVKPGKVEGTYKDGGPPVSLTTNAGTIKLKIK
jgi:hypothetical protein